MIYHAHKRTEDFVIGMVEQAPFFAFQIPAFDRELEPYLRFRRFSLRVRKLADKRGFITSLSPRFRNIGADASG